MNVSYVAAAAVAVVAGFIHSYVGERAILSRLRVDALPPNPFGTPAVTKDLIRGTWHLFTVAVAVSAGALSACAGSPAAGACRGTGRIVAAMFAAFALFAVSRVLARRRPSMILRHPAFAAFAAVAILSWSGSA